MLPDQAVPFLRTLHHWLIDESHTIGGIRIGIDLHKAADIFNAAYNDKSGSTAAFNVNASDGINRIAKAGFQMANFKHHALINQQERRTEMHLINQCDHQMTVVGEKIQLVKGETIHTENFYKYTMESFDDLVNSAGFEGKKSWWGGDQYFGFHYLEAHAG